jgi:hypothetical protein
MPETMLRRISITLGAVLIYRAGLYVPLPGINPAIWDQIFRTDSTFGSLGPLFTSGGIHRLSIFGIGIFSYIAAAVVLQLATVVSPRLAALRQQGWRGRQIVVRRTRYLTTLFATFQACALAFALNKDSVARDPGLPFIISTAVTLTGGTMFLVWLSDQITLRGVGNGIAVIEPEMPLQFKMPARPRQRASATNTALADEVVHQVGSALAIVRGSFEAGSYRRDRTLESEQLASDLTRNPAPLRLVREPPQFSLRLTNARIHVRRRKARLRLGYRTASARQAPLRSGFPCQAAFVQQPKSMTAHQHARYGA